MKITRRGIAGLIGALFAAPAAAKVAVEPEVPAEPLYEELWATGAHTHTISSAALPAHTHTIPCGCHQHCIRCVPHSHGICGCAGLNDKPIRGHWHGATSDTLHWHGVNT